MLHWLARLLLVVTIILVPFSPMTGKAVACPSGSAGEGGSRIMVGHTMAMPHAAQVSHTTCLPGVPHHAVASDCCPLCLSASIVGVSSPARSLLTGERLALLRPAPLAGHVVAPADDPPRA